MAIKDVNVTIGADTSGLQTGLAQAQAAVVRSVEGMKGRFASLTGALGQVQTAMAAFAAVLAGGALFKAAISETTKLNVEALELGKKFGVTASQASVLAVALDDVYLSQEQFAGGASRITRTLGASEESFTRLGVSTRDANGDLRNTFDIMQDVNVRLLTFKEGTDRNVEGVKIYGRGWAEVAPTLRLTGEVMESARKKAESLGLVVGVESQANTARYRAAMNDVGDVLSALGNAIGQALMPALSALAEWFSSIGPEAVQATKVAFVGLVVAFQAIKASILITYEFLKSTFEKLVVYALSFSEAVSRAMVYDFSGAKSAWERGMEQIDDINNRSAAKIQKTWDDAKGAVTDSMSSAFGTPTETPAPTGTETSEGGDVTVKPRTSQWEAELAQSKAAFAAMTSERGQFQEFSKQMEISYWRDILATQKTTAEESKAIQAKIATFETAIRKEKFTSEIDGLKERETALSADATSRLAIAESIATRMGLAYGLDSKEYAAARKEVVATERQIQDQLKQIRGIQDGVATKMALAGIDEEESAARDRVVMAQQTDAQLIEELRGFEERRRAIKLEALQNSLQLALQDPDRNPVQLAQIQGSIAELEIQHQEKLNQIRSQAVRAGQKTWMQPIKSLESSFGSAMSGMLKNTQSFSMGVRNLMTTVVGSIVDMFAQMAAAWAVQQLTSLVMTKTIGASTIATKAAEAGAAGTASMAGAPWPINMSAPAFGLAMAASAGAYGAGLAAEQGFDVPAGMNPVTQLHQREMVLPAELADAVRSSVGGGGGGGRQTVVVQAMDAAGVAKWARNPANQRSLFDAISRQAGRKFSPGFR